MATERSGELLRLLRKKGISEELSYVITYRYMNTDYTAMRMIGYLRSMPAGLREEDVVDEMLAILSDRDRFAAKHMAEHAQAAINEMYLEGFDEEDC